MGHKRRKAKSSDARHAGPTRGRHVSLEGVLRVARPGSAVVETAEGSFVVARSGLNGGMDGDVATVELVRRGPGDPKAVVRSVVARATTSFVGTFGVAGPLGAVVPLDERVSNDFFVLPTDASPARLGVREGDVVVARILTYPSRREEGVVTLERRLGASNSLDLPIERVIASHGLRTTFPDRVLAEAERIEACVEATLAAQPMRRDLREIPCVTVDPVDARDFDDAVSCERTPEGGYVLGVHIADVTQYVPRASAVDVEACQRTCSAYLVDRVIPMLPERLSNDVCSLRPGEDRLAMSVLVRLDSAGNVLEATACASAIRSRARLDYGTVGEVLSGRRDASALACEADVSCEDVAKMLGGLDELARLRTRARAKRGAIDFEGVEPKVTLDGGGVPTGVTVRRKMAATSLVEEAMLVANEAVAQMLAEHEAPCAFRVHEQPAPESLFATLPVLRELELLHPGDAERLHAGDPRAIQAVIARAKGTSAEVLASTLLLRAMKRAVYKPANEGHYALGASAYCHFTSPIRRYPDVTVHRALKRLLGVPVPCQRDGRGASGASAQGRRARELPSKMLQRDWREVRRLLPQLCRTCSEMEREADAAARESQAVKMAELYAARIGESFSGVVSGCERFGLFVRLDDTCAEGLLPTRSLGEEWFAYDEGTLSLTGEASGKCWGIGMRVAVTVAGCNPARGQIDFTLAGGPRGRRGTAGGRKD